MIAPFLLAVSLIPATRGIMFRMPPLPMVWWKVNLMLMFAVVVVLFRWLGGYRCRLSRSTRRWFLMPILLLGLWQVISLAWNGQESLMRQYSFVQSVAMCAAVLSGVLLTSGLAYTTRMRVGRGLTLLIAFVVAVYMGLSFVFPGWRPSTAWVDRTTGTLGFIRVFGPLGTATTLNFVLVPALGFSIGMLVRPNSIKIYWSAASLFFIVAILSTGSRGGLVSLAAFAILLVLSLRLRSILFLLPIGIVLAVIVAAVGVPEKFRDFEDRARVTTYATGWRAYVSSPRNVVIGAGHGALYSALHDQALRTLRGRRRWYLLSHRTAFGYTLRNSHSALLRSLVETGVPGFALMVVPLGWMLRRLLLAPSFRNLPKADKIQATCTLAGCAAVIPYMALEEFFVTAFWIVFLWTVLAVIGAETMAETRPAAAISQGSN